ncbi:sulfatase-like hydrolase/transferase [Fulvivirgaceae bacterium BMA10]|uniref:Sulfatase-like hydrolase/transferase n=1 Tax=Splendidivirga corallicola TaxID=3051826 RepID=A0ABT8KRH1_9BACT|nr:sulfatase-like hydrolase/transferase [Fulvivirgaceae bacterium BMA10]
MHVRCDYLARLLYLMPFLTGLVACSQTGRESSTKPNIVILYTDDQRFNTIHALGNEEISTPNIDQLMTEGTTFTRAHTMGGESGALCVPSRAMLNTGRYINSLASYGAVIPSRHTMMPELLKELGYKTFATGKWHNDRNSFVRSFTDGDNIFFGGMHMPDVGGHERPWLYHFDSTGKYPPEAKWQGNGFSSNYFADAAVEFIQKQQDVDQPFYCYVAFSSPHDPRTPPKEFAEYYKSREVTLPENFMLEPLFDNGELKVRDELLLPTPRPPDLVQRELALYYGMISEVDAQIGRIIKTLKETEQWENTILVYAGDNGLAVGSHGLLGKQNLYEHSMRVPLIMAGPGVPENQKSDALCYLSDIFPTICDLLSVEKPNTVEAKSLASIFRNPEADFRDEIYYLYRDFQRGVRTADNWKLIKYHVRGQETTQLFNLNNDPDELINLADHPAFTNQLNELTQRLKNQMAFYGDKLNIDKSNWGKRIPVARKINQKHLAVGKKIHLTSPPSSKYDGEEPDALINGKAGLLENFTYLWQGFEGNDLEAVIDLGKSTTVNKISAGFLQNTSSWIFLPQHVEFAISTNGQSYEVVADLKHTTSEEDLEPAIEDFSQKIDSKQARYIRVKAKNLGTCPNWHQGAGQKAWMFADEIVVE